LAAIRVQEAASWRIDEIYRYTLARWGEEQADRYITGLFEAFARIAAGETASRPIRPSSASKAMFCAMSGTSSTGAGSGTATSAL
jgi:plasmid stabilization system protein ParE